MIQSNTLQHLRSGMRFLSTASNVSSSQFPSSSSSSSSSSICVYVYFIIELKVAVAVTVAVVGDGDDRKYLLRIRQTEAYT